MKDMRQEYMPIGREREARTGRAAKRLPAWKAVGVRVGLISDIHGNVPAFEAVLADLEQQNVDRVVCLGDICFGPQAHECLEIVRGLGCPVILGNWDSWSIHGFPPADDPVGIML